MTREEEIKTLREVLEDEYYYLTSIGDTQEGFETVAVEYGENDRWARSVCITTKSPSGRLFQWYYEQGLTESQENVLCKNQGINEVRAYTETVTITKYKTVTEEESLKEEFKDRVEDMLASMLADNQFQGENGTRHLLMIIDYKFIVHCTVKLRWECMTGGGASAIYDTNMEDLEIKSIEKIIGDCHLVDY